MRRYYCILLFYFGMSTLAIAQDVGLKAWFDLQRDESGLAVMQGMVKNKSGKVMAYSYSMRLNKTAPSGNAINTQSGSFTLLPGEQKALSAVSINLSATAHFEINLKVFDDERIAAEEKLISDQQFLADFKKLIPQKQKTVSPTPEKEVVKTKSKNTDALEIEGLIIDETRSKTGRDFYDQFYSKWVAPAGVSDFTIIIRELPARGRAARVSVEVNGNLVVQRMLQPRLDVIEILAEQSVNVVKKRLVDNEKLKNDLENGDQQGSGIF